MDVLNKLEAKEKILGEITVIVSAQPLQNLEDISDQQILDFAKDLKIKKLGISAISRLISEKYEVSKRRVYQLIIENQK